MDEIDERIIQILDFLKIENYVSSDSQFAESIGMERQNLSNIKNKKGRHFTVKDINNICKTYTINANFIFGFNNEKLRIKRQSKPTI